MEKLQEFVNEHSFKGAWLQGIGAALELEIGYYDLDTREYHWKSLPGMHEITSLQGNMVRNEPGEPIFHIHGTFSDTDLQVVGGHVRHLVVGGTCELIIREFTADITRRTDKMTGLQLLCNP